MKRIVISLLSFLLAGHLFAQHMPELQWLENGSRFVYLSGGQLMSEDLGTGAEEVVASKAQLTPAGSKEALTVENYSINKDGSLVLLFTNSARVWRYNTRGDYWLYDRKTGKIRQLGKSRPSQSLMFAKLSPDGRRAAYVSQKNIYVEDLATGTVRALTVSGKDKLINGTFDWVYEEEFFCRDGFRWSPDSRYIAYWQVDATGTRDYYMVNNTDSIYPRIIPVEYPKVGQPISLVRIGVADVQTAVTKWMDIPGGKQDHYLTRMEWSPAGSELIVQQLNRNQQESILYLCNGKTGQAKNIFSEKDRAWIDVISLWDEDYYNGGWDWLENGGRFLWASEKDGWRHLYSISRDGKESKLLTSGNYDVIDIVRVDQTGGYVYFMASPDNATQKYLYRVPLRGSGAAERISPANQSGTHSYLISGNAKFAFHDFSNYYTPTTSEWVSLPDHRCISGQSTVDDAVKKADKSASNIEFFTVTTPDGVKMDAWMQKPKGFDKSRKYPVVFYVYTEPWGQEVKDVYGITGNRLYKGDMAEDGYLYVCIDNRGTPVPKGRDWRKSIYRKIGLLNISDQAKAAREILKWNYADSSRVAVWGWSGGGTATLNLMFQYPEIYKTGIAIAAVANQFTYDNIYQERYMGQPSVTREDYVRGSPITYAKNLRGNLLYIHGTGDDNVHYQNAEMLLNELIKYNRQFQFMPYPNRSHGIYEGEGTSLHLSTLYTEYLKRNCPPGAR